MPKAPKAPVGKSKKVVHPNSRQALYIQRQAIHDQKVMKNKAVATIKLEQLQQKLLWYQTNLDSQKSTYTKHDVAELTGKYLDRFKEELEQIVIVNAVGNRQSKQHQARETAIRFTEERENGEFDSVGVEVPDLVNGKNLEYFRNWSGEIRYFPNIKLKKSKRLDLKTEVKENEGEQTEEDDEKSTEELPDYIDSIDNNDTDSINKSDNELVDYIDT